MNNIFLRRYIAVVLAGFLSAGALLGMSDLRRPNWKDVTWLPDPGCNLVKLLAETSDGKQHPVYLDVKKEVDVLAPNDIWQAVMEVVYGTPELYKALDRPGSPGACLVCLQYLGRSLSEWKQIPVWKLLEEKPVLSLAFLTSQELEQESQKAPKKSLRVKVPRPLLVSLNNSVYN